MRYPHQALHNNVQYSVSASSALKLSDAHKSTRNSILRRFSAFLEKV